MRALAFAVVFLATPGSVSAQCCDLVAAPESGGASLTFQVQKSCLKAGTDLQGEDLTATLDGTPRPLVWTRSEDVLSFTFIASDTNLAPGQHVYEVKVNLGGQACSAKYTFGFITSPDASPTDGGVDVSASDVGTTENGDSGCSVGRPGAASSSFAWLLLFAPLARRRRRRPGSRRHR